MAYARYHNGLLNCSLCPHTCKIPDGESGLCRVRGNRGGELDLPFYGVLSSVGIDPIEKKPLYHFLPGTTSYSAGFWGCNMRCPFCQNYQISQHTHSGGAAVDPVAVVKAARESGASSISYTYSEPVVHFEYILATAHIARREGLANVIVTNGLINPKPARELFAVMDAANIDLKSFNQAYYSEELGGRLETVKNTIAVAAELCHLELTTLIVPEMNDSVVELDELFTFIAAVDRNLPLHLSRYFPRYKATAAETALSSIKSIVHHAERHLQFVYPGNTGGPADTCCDGCGETLISRNGYTVDIINTDKENCDSCRKTLPYITALTGNDGSKEN